MAARQNGMVDLKMKFEKWYGSPLKQGSLRDHERILSWPLHNPVNDCRTEPRNPLMNPYFLFLILILLLLAFQGDRISYAISKLQ